MRASVAGKTENCTKCNFCKFMLNCSQQRCIGCGQCVSACPNEARVMLPIRRNERIRLVVDGKRVEVPKQITILKALELVGYTVSNHPKQDGDILAPCQMGGCGACAVLVNGKLKPSCTTEAEEGMDIRTEPAEIILKEPIRLANHFDAYQGGIIGAAPIRTSGVTEYAFFAQGCNLRCPACHNWDITFSSIGKYCTPRQAAEIMERGRVRSGVSKISLTGGEITLNRPWLMQFLREFKTLCSLPEVTIQLDSNASFLSPDYIDQLFEAGITDISPDVKGLYLDTYMRFTGGHDRELAELNVKTSWQAVEYLLQEYMQKMFIVLAIPYHAAFIGMEEIQEIARRIFALNPDVCISLIDYQPAFRRRDLPATSTKGMEEVHQILLDSGLRRVLWQTGDRLGLALDPDDLFLELNTF
ncbi:cyclic pyranopterin monophosphate synthase [Peptococcaceae bacterium CEB3]|nr:cyclic pyranopterin monophosphate synthase [Peptococcaceae bacterium CEB3]